MQRLKKLKKQYQAKLIFSEYYDVVKKDLIDLLRWYKAQGKVIAIWGSDLKGLAFLQMMDPKSEFVSFIIDINEKKIGELMVGRKTISCYNLKEKNIDVVLMLNQKHLIQNYNILKDEGITCLVHDVDEIVKKRLDLQEMKEQRDMEDDTEQKIRMTKSIQKELIPLLEEVDKVCKKYKIQYFLCAGSALGAVRHKGFIPWDDDIDIGMLRRDYDRFLEIADEALGKNFLLMDANRSPNYYVCHAKVFRNHTALVNRDTCHLQIHHGFYLDIFPFDIIPEDKKLQDRMYKEQEEARELFCRCKKIKKYSGKNPLKKYLANEDYYKMQFRSSKKILNNLNKILTQYNKNQPIWVADFSAPYNKKLFFKYDDIFPIVEGEFEGKKYPIPHDVNRYLSIMYGDYLELPPKDKRFVKHDIIMFDLHNNYTEDEKWLKKYYKMIKINKN